MHGLQHYTDILIANGYDDVQFLGEVPDLELQEIGILDPTDRQRVSIMIKNSHSETSYLSQSLMHIDISL